MYINTGIHLKFALWGNHMPQNFIVLLPVIFTEKALCRIIFQKEDNGHLSYLGR